MRSADPERARRLPDHALEVTLEVRPVGVAERGELGRVAARELSCGLVQAIALDDPLLARADQRAEGALERLPRSGSRNDSAIAIRASSSRVSAMARIHAATAPRGPSRSPSGKIRYVMRVIEAPSSDSNIAGRNVIPSFHPLPSMWLATRGRSPPPTSIELPIAAAC